MSGSVTQCYSTGAFVVITSGFTTPNSKSDAVINTAKLKTFKQNIDKRVFPLFTQHTLNVLLILATDSQSTKLFCKAIARTIHIHNMRFLF